MLSKEEAAEEGYLIDSPARGIETVTGLYRGRSSTTACRHNVVNGGRRRFINPMREGASNLKMDESSARTFSSRSWRQVLSGSHESASGRKRLAEKRSLMGNSLRTRLKASLARAR